jgi:hypothetical protein
MTVKPRLRSATIGRFYPTIGIRPPLRSALRPAYDRLRSACVLPPYNPRAVVGPLSAWNGRAVNARKGRETGKGREDLNGRDTQLTAKSRSACWTASLRSRCHRRATAPDKARAITAGRNLVSNSLGRRSRLRGTVSVTAWAAERRSHVLPVGMKAAKISHQPIERAAGSPVPSCVARSPENRARGRDMPGEMPSALQGCRRPQRVPSGRVGCRVGPDPARTWIIDVSKLFRGRPVKKPVSKNSGRAD